MAFAMSLSGIFFACFKGVYFSAVLLCYFPIMFGATYFMTIAFSSGYALSMRAYG